MRKSLPIFLGQLSSSQILFCPFGKFICPFMVS